MQSGESGQQLLEEAISIVMHPFRSAIKNVGNLRPCQFFRQTEPVPEYNLF